MSESKSEKRNRERELAERVEVWESDEVRKKGWRNAPEALPALTGTTPITLRMPAQALQIIRELARRKAIGYQVLLKQWIDDRLRREYEDLRNAQRTIVFGQTRIVRQVATAAFRSTRGETVLGIQ